MASFVGSKEEFNRYIGPRLRNLVQQITRKRKMEIGRCEHCGHTESLEAAHIHGRNRSAIIDRILNQYTNNSVVTIDLADFEKHFRNEHHIIDETILILCRTCHTKYDAEPNTAPNPASKPAPSGGKRNRLFSNQEIQQRISKVAKSLTDQELEQLCGKRKSKEEFDINFPLFIRVPKNTSSSIHDAVKDEQGVNRWTWKYQFEKDGFLYAITTQWYEKNDKHVKQWLSKYEEST